MKDLVPKLSFPTFAREDEVDRGRTWKPLTGCTTEHARKPTESQKRLVHKVHANTGHPAQADFLRMMRAAGAHDYILKYIN